jgi:hypothetical protein
MASDAARMAAGEKEFLRLAADHEFCHPSFPCLTWPTVVLVTAIAPGVRARRPIAAREIAA